MKLEPLAQYLKDQDIAIPGTDLFIYEMPSSVKVGILILTSLSGTNINYELPDYRKTTFQVIVRHTDHVKGRELAELVSSGLTMSGATLEGMSVNYIRPKHEPVVYPVSEGDFLEFSVNFDANFCYNQTT
jgi:hypothetical protein